METAPIRVLIADDDASFLEALRTLVDRQPELKVVAAAEDGAAAVELAERLEPDAAVIDLHMPRLDGLAAVARLRAAHPNLCLIVLTGDPDEQLQRAALEAGADEVLEKHALARGLVERLAAAR